MVEEYAARTKYDAPGRALRYAERSARRDAEEWALLEAALERLVPAPASALDVPCGAGRIAERLLARGLPTLAADLSPAMRDVAEARLCGRPGWGGVRALDLERAPPEDLRADLVVCFRFFHHLPSAAARERVLGSLAALSRRDVLLSFHHPVSVHNLSRALRRVVTGRRGDRHTLTVRRLAAEGHAAGLELVATSALARWRREFWLAHFRTRRPA